VSPGSSWLAGAAQALPARERVGESYTGTGTRGFQSPQIQHGCAALCGMQVLGVAKINVMALSQIRAR